MWSKIAEELGVHWWEAEALLKQLWQQSELADQSSVASPAPPSSYQSQLPRYQSQIPPAKRHQTGHPGQAVPQRPARQLQAPLSRFIKPAEVAQGHRNRYDMVPPPLTSGCAPTNPPQTSGFTPINQASPSSPTAMQNGETTAPIQYSRKDPADRKDTPAPGTGASGAGPGSGKRTPSSKHVSTQLKAFNNRHHTCERIDVLNRGIWTFYGPGGTENHPTGPPVEMYLRCSHDDCRRMDWTTVHGFQCHIVRLHKIPRGTINIEKALDAYGVPISEVEEHEKAHGPGSSGEMADPNAKLKIIAKAASEMTQQGSVYSMQVPEDSPASQKRHARDSPHQ